MAYPVKPARQNNFPSRKATYPFSSSALFIQEGAVVNHINVPAAINILQVSALMLPLNTRMAGIMDNPKPAYEIIFTIFFISLSLLNYRLWGFCYRLFLVDFAGYDIYQNSNKPSRKSEKEHLNTSKNIEHEAKRKREAPSQCCGPIQF